MVYQVSSLGSSMDSLENQALPPDSMAVNAATLEERNTPTNNLEKRQHSSKTHDSDTEVLWLDLVRTELHLSKIFQSLLLWKFIC